MEALTSKDLDCNHSPMLTKLLDAGMYHIDEIYIATAEVLKGMSLLPAEAN